MRWVNVQEIYADGKHNAWPDICRWRNRYYVTFNSGGVGHSNGHSICLLSSTDGERWEKVLERPSMEWTISTDATRGALCPKLLPTNDRLIVMFYYYAPGEANVSDEQKQHLKGRWLELNGSEQSFERWIGHHNVSFRTGLTFTEDGRTFSPPQPLFDPSWRVWRPHTFDGRHYVIGFRCHGQSWRISPELERMIPVADSIEMFESASLFASEDGIQWSQVNNIGVDDNDEPDFDFTTEGRILAVSRTGASLSADRPAMAYVSNPPYADWQRLTLSAPLHSPAVRRANDQWVVAGRALVPGSERPARFAPDTAFDAYGPTRLWLLDEQTGELTEGTTLPSWGDSAYPGIEVTDEGDLLVVYYSCSETIDDNLLMGPGPLPGKYAPTSIYLARVVME